MKYSLIILAIVIVSFSRTAAPPGLGMVEWDDVSEKDKNKESHHKEKEHNHCRLGKKVDDAESCLSLSNDKILCCHLMSSFPKKSVCFPMKKEMYDSNNQLSFGGIEYKMTCNNDKPTEKKVIRFGDKCGKEDAKSKEDCAKNNAHTSSCCFYSMFKKTGCVYAGIITKGQVKMYGMEVDCS